MNADQDFVEPPWDAPLDPQAVIRGIPETASIAGMFLSPAARAAETRGTRLPSARERYVPFSFYPLREHCQLLLEACALLFPGVPLRRALCKLGRAAPDALLASTIGKVTLGAAPNVEHALEAICKTYPINIRPCRVQILASAAGRYVVRFEDLHFFLDSHHAGVLEGTMRFAGVNGKVRIRAYAPQRADLLCTWDVPKRDVSPR